MRYSFGTVTGDVIFQGNSRHDRGKENPVSVNLYLDTSPIDLDDEGLDVAHARVLHEHAEVRSCTAPIGRKRLVDVCRNRMIQRLAGGDVELDVMHRAGHDGAVQRTHLQRAVHVATAPVDGVIAAIAIAHDDFSLAGFHKFHPARGDLTGLRDFHQHPWPF